MSNTDINRIIDRIKKLLALSKSPNENEAANAAAAAAKLQEQYQIEQATLEDQGEAFEVEEIIDFALTEGVKKNASWKGQIIMAVAELNGCQAYLKGTNWTVFGRRSNTQTTHYTTQYLFTQIEGIAKKAHKEAGLVPVSTRTWLNSFRWGCALRVASRIKELHRMNVAVRENEINSGNRAMIVLTKHDLEVRDAWRTKSANFTTNKARGARGCRDAFDQGKAAGDGISIGGSRPQLGPAPGRIAA